ncbi:MAG: hypothetical protein R6U40_14700 [Desulfobacterales bacterium]
MLVWRVTMAFYLVEGNEAIAWGAVASECRLFAGYPITPATTIFNAMLKLLGLQSLARYVRP